MMVERAAGDFPYLAFSDLTAIPGFVHAVTTRANDGFRPARRLGQAPSLEPEFLSALGVPSSNLILLKQEHADEVLAVDAARPSGFAGNPSADAVVLSSPGWYSAIRTADCLSVLIVEPRRRFVGLVHAGWRGTCKRVTAKAVAHLLRLSAAAAGDLWVGFGPCIRNCCYEVGEEVKGAYRARGHETGEIFQGRCLDLIRANRLQLEQLGVRRIVDSGFCTSCCNDRFYSYRREKTDRRIWTLAGFRPAAG